jgi:hypothetical protein
VARIGNTSTKEKVAERAQFPPRRKFRAMIISKELNLLQKQYQETTIWMRMRSDRWLIVWDDSNFCLSHS